MADIYLLKPSKGINSVEAKRLASHSARAWFVLIHRQIERRNLFRLTVACRLDDDRHDSRAPDDVLAVAIGQAKVEQLGIGGWQVPREGVQEARKRNTNVLTIADIEKIGLDKTAEIALDLAWKDADAVYISFGVDSIDCGFVPGTGWREPGGFARMIERVGVEARLRFKAHPHMLRHACGYSASLIGISLVTGFTR